MPQTQALLRELNHRVKNNFQIIVSLMNLKKRLLPPDRREDIRFIEEHVTSMALAYRLVYATGDMAAVGAAELIGELVAGLRQIAGVAGEKVQIDLSGVEGVIPLDHAIALGLYMAVVCPPYLDLTQQDGAATMVQGRMEGEGMLELSLTHGDDRPVELDFLRRRLMNAYIGQLQAEVLPPAKPSELRIRLALEPRIS